MLITSEKMTASKALELYKSRDVSEKLFRMDKTFLGIKSIPAHSNESVQAKMFIEFVALIIRNRLYTCLKEQTAKSSHKQNFMTVPAAIRELEKIELIRQSDGEYRMDYAVTATQNKVVSKAKDRYDAAVAEFEKLMKKRDGIRNKELLDAFVSSDKSYDEFKEFLSGKSDNE